MKFIGIKREFGKVIIESEVTLQNPDMMVALFTLMIMKGALGDPDYVTGAPKARRSGELMEFLDCASFSDRRNNE